MITRQRKRIYALAYAKLKNSTLAEDAVQETSLRMWKASPHLCFSSRAQEIKYISLTVCSTVQDILKKRGSTEVISLDALVQEPSAYGFDPDLIGAVSIGLDADPTYEAAADREAMARASTLLEQTGARCFAILSFRQMGYTDSVIAESLDISTDDVRVIAHRGRKKLRELMKEEDLLS